MTDPVGSLRSMLAAVVAGDAEGIVDAYAGREDLLVYLEGPRWQTVGHTAVAKGWRDFCAAGPSVSGIEFADGPHLVESAAMACLSGTVEMRLRASVTPPAPTLRPPVKVQMRLTWVMQRDPDRWRIVHEHASQPMPDPYGTGDWLVQETPA